MASIDFDLATPDDDAALRAILRTNAMPGAIAVTFEREPSYFQAAALEGPFHQTLVAREQASGAVLGMGSRSVRELFVNGVAQPVGYMSQLRVNPHYRWGLALARVISQGWHFFHRLHQDGRTKFYLLSVIADNAAAQRLLTANLPHFPQLQPYQRLHTYALYTRRRKSILPLPAPLRLVRGSAALLPAILACLHRYNARHQFGPVWTTETLCQPTHTPALRPEDFFLALHGEQVVGCLACWDQTAFKQTVVRGYAPTIARWRHLINGAALLGGWPVLPPPNTALRACFASHLALDDDHPQVFAALLRAVYNHAVTQAYSYVMLGLSDQHPLCSVLTQSYRQITYTSQLYLAAWADGLDAVAHMDARLPGPEIALL